MKKSNKNISENEFEQPVVDQVQEESEAEGQESPASRDWEKDFNEMNDKYLRLYSEFDNFRRRTAREKLEMLKNASADVLTELIPVTDDFERTIQSIDKAKEDSQEAMLEGMKLVHSKFMSVLQRQGLSPMDSMEKDFDPDFHEAITKIPAPSKKLKGKVVDVIEKGYMLNEKVLRYAKVVVGE